MTVICGWCEHEGAVGFLGFSGCSSDLRKSHGICIKHLDQLRKTGGKVSTRKSEEPSFQQKALEKREYI